MFLIQDLSPEENIYSELNFSTCTQPPGETQGSESQDLDSQHSLSELGNLEMITTFEEYMRLSSPDSGYRESSPREENCVFLEPDKLSCVDPVLVQMKPVNIPIFTLARESKLQQIPNLSRSEGRSRPGPPAGPGWSRWSRWSYSSSSSSDSEVYLEPAGRRRWEKTGVEKTAGWCCESIL